MIQASHVAHAAEEIKRYLAPAVDYLARAEIVALDFQRMNKDIRDYSLCEELHYSEMTNTSTVKLVWRKRIKDQGFATWPMNYRHG